MHVYFTLLWHLEQTFNSIQLDSTHARGLTYTCCVVCIELISSNAVACEASNGIYA